MILETISARGFLPSVSLSAMRLSHSDQLIDILYFTVGGVFGFAVFL